MQWTIAQMQENKLVSFIPHCITTQGSRIRKWILHTAASIKAVCAYAPNSRLRITLLILPLSHSSYMGRYSATIRDGLCQRIARRLFVSLE